jgi:hypothetical protein
MCGPRREEVAGGWGKLHNEELRDVYSSPYNDAMGGTCRIRREEKKYM